MSGHEQHFSNWATTLSVLKRENTYLFIGRTALNISIPVQSLDA